METWHILIYGFGAVGGGLIGIIITALLYYLLCRFILKDPRTLSAVLHVAFVGKHSTPSSVSIKPLPDYKYSALNRTKERFGEAKRMRLQPLTVVEKRPVPVQTLVRPTLAAATIEQNLAPAKIMTKSSRNSPEVKDQPTPVRKLAEPCPVNSEMDSRIERIAGDLLFEIKNNYKIAKEFSGGNLVSLKTDTWDASQSSIRTLPAKLRDELEDLYGVIKMLNNLVWFSSEFQRHSTAVTEQYSNILTAIIGKLNELMASPLLKTS